MLSLQKPILAVALLMTGIAPIAATPVEAREHGRLSAGRGPHGGGYISGRHVSREPGRTVVSRGVLTGGGHGYRQTRTTTRGDGTITNDVQRRKANGSEVRRTGSVTRNADNSVSRQHTRTGANGNSQSGWSTIYRTEDGYSKSRGASTSNGRGYTATRDVSVGEDSVTINRNATTNSGREVSRTRTVPRPR
ncbi:hypothetical protein [Sphingopyxis sp. JAI128]|uniref:hypothetical protein n=1 Tax=Sphingopyxis sp. JAI128 TaxID=2723066 RepID=UPI00161C47E6|nr:hypothetical protein [Sphingopyxis sp. JAI128]MBB6427003.1 hypothetical protein [Sphingopyxis sp. JAI128]